MYKQLLLFSTYHDKIAESLYPKSQNIQLSINEYSPPNIPAKSWLLLSFIVAFGIAALPINIKGVVIIAHSKRHQKRSKCSYYLILVEDIDTQVVSYRAVGILPGCT